MSSLLLKEIHNHVICPYMVETLILWFLFYVIQYKNENINSTFSFFNSFSFIIIDFIQDRVQRVQYGVEYIHVCAN